MTTLLPAQTIHVPQMLSQILAELAGALKRHLPRSPRSQLIYDHDVGRWTGVLEILRGASPKAGEAPVELKTLVHWPHQAELAAAAVAEGRRKADSFGRSRWQDSREEKVFVMVHYRWLPRPHWTTQDIAELGLLYMALNGAVPPMADMDDYQIIIPATYYEQKCGLEECSALQAWYLDFADAFHPVRLGSALGRFATHADAVLRWLAVDRPLPSERYRRENKEMF